MNRLEEALLSSTSTLIYNCIDEVNAVVGDLTGIVPIQLVIPYGNGEIHVDKLATVEGGVCLDIDLYLHDDAHSPSPDFTSIVQNGVCTCHLSLFKNIVGYLLKEIKENDNHKK